jgi:hypothetical protein
MAKRGRKPTPEAERNRIIAHVLAETATGRFISRILAEDEDMPGHTTWWKWVFEDEKLSEKVVQARAHGVEAMLDECGEIADDGTNDFVKKPKKDEGDPDEYAFDKEHVQRSKLRVETRIKLAQMLKPKTYGPKLDLTSGGDKIALSAEVEAARRRAAESE